MTLNEMMTVADVNGFRQILCVIQHSDNKLVEFGDLFS
jgi:hypothetical protein